MDTSRYVAELQSLKAVLLAAKAEQEALEKRVGEVSKRQEQEQPGDISRPNRLRWHSLRFWPC